MRLSVRNPRASVGGIVLQRQPIAPFPTEAKETINPTVKYENQQCAERTAGWN